MNKQNFFFKQKVTAPEMNEIYTQTETEFYRFCSTLWRQAWGISNYEAGGGNQMTFSGKTITLPYRTLARASGKHINIEPGTTYTIPDAAWSDVPDATKEKDLRILIYHTYAQSNPRIDGYGDTVYYNQDDSYYFDYISGTVRASGGILTYPTHPLDGGCSLCCVTIGADGSGAKIIKGLSTYPNRGGDFSKAQDRIEGLGIQAVDYWGTNVCVVTFYLPTPGTTRILYHGFGPNTKCFYAYALYANRGGKFASYSKDPAFYGMLGTGGHGAYADEQGIVIQDFPGGGKFRIFVGLALAGGFDGAKCDVFCIKIH